MILLGSSLFFMLTVVCFCEQKPATIDEVLTVLNKQQREIEDLKRDVVELQSENKLLRAQQSEKANSQKRLLLNPPTAIATKSVAFSANLGDHVHGLGNEQTIVFDKVITNVGSGYSGVSGYFTAPYNGTYFFMATIMCFSGDYIEAEMIVNGRGLINFYASDSTRYEQSSGGVTLTLYEGDLVWVRHRSQEGTALHVWSSFTGFKISD